jgi:hypothetical protein
MEPYEDLSPLQRKAHLAFWYDSEVNNGGHAQYLDNLGNDRVPETIEALKDLGGGHFADVLSEVFEAHMKETGRIDNWSEATSQRVAELDSVFYSARPTIPELLERYLEANERAFVEIVDGS